MSVAFTDLDGLVDCIPDGASLILPAERAGGCAMALVRRAIQRGVRDLRLVGARDSGMQAALLLGAGCAEAAGGAGVAPRAAKVDVAIFHAAKVDRQGNVRIDGMPHLRTLAAAAASVVASYEECVAAELMADATDAADTLPAAAVTALAKAPRGSWPLGLPGYYAADTDHLALYRKAAATEDGLQAYLLDHVYQRLAVD